MARGQRMLRQQAVAIAIGVAWTAALTLGGGDARLASAQPVAGARPTAQTTFVDRYVDHDRPDNPLLPWTSADSLYDWPRASRYWNLTHRAGRFSVGLDVDVRSFRATSDARLQDPPDGVSPGTRDPAIHRASLVETLATVTLGVALFESLRLRFGLGASVINLRPDRRSALNPDDLTFDRYGPAVGGRVGLSYAPVLGSLPYWLTPVFDVELTRYSAGADESAARTVAATVLRVDLTFHAQLLEHPRQGVSIGVLAGVGMYVYDGTYTDGGRARTFTTPSGGGARLPFGDIGFTVGAIAMLDDTLIVRLEGRTGPVSVVLTIELVAE